MTTDSNIPSTLETDIHLEFMDALIAYDEAYKALTAQRVVLEEACKVYADRMAIMEQRERRPIILKMHKMFDYAGFKFRVPFDIWYGPQRNQTLPWKLLTGSATKLFIKEWETLGGIHPLPPSRRKDI